MTTFKQFILEKREFDLEKFKSDCAYMLSLLKNTRGGHMLYHGTRSYPDDFDIGQWRPRPGPKDSHKIAHEKFNEFFMDKFGEPVRNWMFGTGLEEDARVYAGYNQPVTAIFPIGKFEWIQGQSDDLRDMTGWLDRVAGEIREADKDNKIDYDTRYRLAADVLVKKMRMIRWRHNTDLIACLNYENEIMFKCDKFYQFNVTGTTFRDVVHPFLRTI